MLVVENGLDWIKGWIAALLVIGRVEMRVNGMRRKDILMTEKTEVLLGWILFKIGSDFIAVLTSLMLCILCSW